MNMWLWFLSIFDDDTVVWGNAFEWSGDVYE